MKCVLAEVLCCRCGGLEASRDVVKLWRKSGKGMEDVRYLYTRLRTVTIEGASSTDDLLWYIVRLCSN